MSPSGAAGLGLTGRRLPLRALGLTGGIALVANGGWELAQRPLYATEPSLLRCLSAAVVDAGYTVAAVAAGMTVARRHPRAFLPVVVVVLAAAAGGIEAWALATERWVYAAAMPLVAGLGLSPLVQLPLLGALAAWTGRRIYYPS